MPLNLIVGRSNSGKSKYIFEKIKKEEKQDNDIILFVPDFARVVAEQEYFSYTQNSGMIKTNITTIKRYVDSQLNTKELYETKEFLPDMSKKYIIKKCILENDKYFNIFKKVKNTEGFIDKLSTFMNALESDKLCQDTLDTVLNGKDFLSLKFKEIYDIYTAVNTETKDRFVTSFGKIDYFIQSVSDGKSGINENLLFYFDQYNNFNNKELLLIEMLLKMGKDVSITLDLDLDNLELTDIFNISYDTYSKLKSLAYKLNVPINEIKLKNSEEASTMLQALQKNIFNLGASLSEIKDDTVEFNVFQNPLDEIKYIAQDILAKVKTTKYEYSDFKISYNNEDMYALMIERVFSKYNIPVYINGSTKITNNSFVTYLKSLLNQIQQGFINVNTDNIMQMLKSSLTKFSFDKIAMFENYLNEFGIKAYKFKDKFERNNKENSMGVVYDLSSINEIREYMYMSITELANKLNNLKDTKTITQVIYDFLQQENIIKEYDLQLESIKDIDINSYNRKSQVLSKIYEVMDDIVIAYKELDFNVYLELLIYGLQNIEVNAIPPFIEQVEVCDIDSTRSTGKKVQYIIGVFENGLPITTNSEGIFSDKEIEELEKLGISIAKTTQSRNSMAMFNVYKAVCSCSESLKFSMPTSKITGEGLRISPVVSRIKDVIALDITTAKSQAVDSLDDVYEQFVQDIREGTNIDKASEEYYLLNKNKKYKEVFEYTRKKEKLSEEIVKKLYDKNIQSSISRLEKFVACPFNYYMTYTLKLKEKKEYKLSKLDMGSIMHKVLEDFSKFLIINNIGFEDILGNERLIKQAQEQISKSIDDIFESMYVKYIASAKYAYLSSKLKKGMLKVIIAISKSFTQSEFRPLGYELEFDNGKLFAPIEIQLENGHKMFLRGKIDRVDTAKIKENVYLRVVDYKSSAKDLKLSDVKEGISLQLMTYMSALLDNSSKIDSSHCVLPAAVSYFTLNTDCLKLSECMSEQEITKKTIESMKMKGIFLNDLEVLNKLDNKFSEPESSYIEMTTRKLSNKEKSLVESEFIQECNNVKEVLKQIASILTTGVVEAKGKEQTCAYCDFSSVCRKNLRA